MNSKYVWLTLALVLGSALAEKTSYTGYKLYNLFPKNQEQADFISQLEHSQDVSFF